LILPPSAAFAHLEPGRHYEVVEPFVDYDSGEHRAGERWTYLTYNFVPYDDGLSLFATIDGLDRQIRMRWTREDQGAIIDALDQYVRPVG
jgi:hypothetical protein